MAAVRAFVSSAVVFPEETCPAVIIVQDGKIREIHRHSTNVSAYNRESVPFVCIVECQTGLSTYLPLPALMINAMFSLVYLA
ncbi:hypothetical protein SK128_007985 [Halocaridina rubra]|uniref:Uncharacterized protein n=1 Tax=Halocaridina rubra TaxID=373956 RepID=A0AAN8WRW4_HALRR